MTMKKIFLLLFIALLGNAAIAQITDYSIFDKKFNFYVANDLGRNGYYDQKPIAELMGQMAEEVGPEFVLATGDVHHFEGVRSVDDPLWMTNYELIYSHPELMIDWFEDNGATIRILWVDTAPMIDKYRNESETYPDACKQDYQQQLSWIDSVLTAAKEDWVIVAGHHPIYAETPKDESERADMQARLDPILRKHKVDMYICGHIHNFQHVRVAGSDIDYITNSAGSLARKVKPIEGTVFCSPEPGFSIVSASKKTLELRMIDKKGNVLHTVTRSK